MNRTVTIDASVFVSAFTPTEPAHQASKAFMLNVREQSIPILVPVLVLPEISAALSCGQGKPELAAAFVREIRNLPNTTFVDVDDAVAALAVEVAANYRLRGSELITLDKEQLDRLPKVLPVRKPE